MAEFDDMPLIERQPTQGALTAYQAAQAHNIPQKELIVLHARGQYFTDWTSVRVEVKMFDPWSQFQFECTENSPMPNTYDKLQFLPGDPVQVFVGGVQTIDGFVSERHVAFDGTTHAVRIVGVSKTIDLTKSTVPLDQLGDHDKKSWSQLTRDIMKHLGIKLKLRGGVDNTPFDNIQVQPGELIIQVIERYARHRNIVIGNTPFGELLGVGPHSAIPASDIHEGYNILACNSVLRDPNTQNKYFAIGQGVSGDQANGAGQNQQICGPLTGSHTRNKHMVVAADLADKQTGICQRARIEKSFGEGSKMEAHITMQGFFKDNNKSSDIWKAGEYYTVTSQMLVLDGTVLGCKGCVYEQSEGGTKTTLELVDPIHMNAESAYRKG